MKQKTLLWLAFILPVFQHSQLFAQSELYQIKSPDKKTEMLVSIDNQRALVYEIKFKGKKVIRKSNLGLIINGHDIGRDLSIVSLKRNTRAETIMWPIGENSIIENNYNELNLSYKSGPLNYNILFRVFNGSVAFRYEVPEQSTVTELMLEKENTSFNLSYPSKIYRYHHESVFTPVLIDSLKRTSDFPSTLKTTLKNKRFYLSIGEADNRNYTKAKLQRGTEANSLSVAFAHDTVVKFSRAFETPWRTVSISETAIGLRKFSELVLKLSSPSTINLRKIVPGKLIRAHLNTQSGLDCIDLAKKLNFKYIMFDAGWYGPQRALSSDPRVPIAAIDLPKVIEYGKQNGIGVILYVNYIGLQNYLDEILPLYKHWGVAGLKLGFIDGFTQQGLIWLTEAIKKVNDAGLILNIHDNYKPTGLSRTYPYLLTQEGIRGDENSPDAFHNTTLPFTRFLAGAADFTFCFPNSKNSFSKYIKVSKAQQLALTVVYFSPLQSIFWYGQPKDYTNFGEIEFFKYVPTVWDESKYLSGSIGKNISVARRKGEVWFIGNAAGFSDWKENLKLDFLDKGKVYKATFYEDGNNGEILKRTSLVKKGDKLLVDIKAKGGQAIMIEPVK
jgi:alpha-glucosidase